MMEALLIVGLVGRSADGLFPWASGRDSNGITASGCSRPQDRAPQTFVVVAVPGLQRGGSIARCTSAGRRRRRTEP